MNELRRDPIIARWLSDGPERGPVHGLERALAATRNVDQRPGWTFPRWWKPTRVADVDIRTRHRVAARPLVVLAMIFLLAIAALYAGTVLRTTRPVLHGHLVAYQQGSTIAVSQPDGSARVEISGAVPFARLPVFSPDGQHVAFVAPSSADANTGRLLVVPVDGAGPPIDVSRGIATLSSDMPQMSWSPSGDRIAFSALKDGVATIFVAASDGSRSPAAITDQTAHRDVPTWSPRGDWIGFRERDLDGLRTRLRRMDPDGTNVQEVTMVIASDAYLSRPRWFRDAYPASYWYDPGGGSDTSAYVDLGFTHRNVLWHGAPGGYADLGLAWSPDGTRLAFVTRDDGVIVADYDSTEPYDGRVRRLGPVAACWVDWVPDGTSLYGGTPDGCNGVVEVPLADPSMATTVPGSTTGFASWQPLAKGG
jgi:hypothetical protein